MTRKPRFGPKIRLKHRAFALELADEKADDGRALYSYIEIADMVEKRFGRKYHHATIGRWCKGEDA